MPDEKRGNYSSVYSFTENSSGFWGVINTLDFRFKNREGVVVKTQ